jgi:hypothetical protein
MNLMEEIITEKGLLYKVWDSNTAKADNATPLYVSVLVEDPDGTNPRYLLLTPSELQRAEYRATQNTQDLNKTIF